MENNVVLNRRKKAKREKIVFVILCVVIALIIAANVIAVTLAYFTDRASGSISIRTGTVDVVGRVWNGSSYSTAELTLGNNVVFPGSITEQQQIELENTGNSSFYIRFSCSLVLDTDNDGDFADEDNMDSFLSISSITMPQGASSVMQGSDGKYYYLGSLAGQQSLTGILIDFQISSSLGNSDLTNLVNYQNINYKMYLNVEVIQSANITLDSSSASAIVASWPI